MDREGGTREQIQAADDEIHMFLKTTLNIFVLAEEESLRKQGLHIWSSLRVSARMDLSVIKNPETQEMNYFVSGVCRGSGILLYGSLSANNIRRYGLDFSHAFLSWIREVDRRSADEVLGVSFDTPISQASDLRKKQEGPSIR